jgi:protocatechuate 3,4-dioxygenase beta subunit
MLNRRRMMMVTLAAAGSSQWLSSARAASPRLPLTARATEGPYYLPQRIDRMDISDGLPGVPLELQLRVMNPAAQRLSAVRVDVWHCDAQGNYSGFDDRRDAGGRTRRYLRGTQHTDVEGDVRFHTVWPGWYPGRTTHIHFKVIAGERALLTSQLYLPDALNEQVYGTASAYLQSRRRDTLNSNDRIALAGGGSQMAAVSQSIAGSIARLDVVVSS